MLTGQNGILTNAQKANNNNVYYGADEQVKLAYMAIKTQIMTETAANSSYNAIADTENLGKIVEKDLSDTNHWKVNYNTQGKIAITYTNPSIKANSIEKGKPAEDGKVQYEIVLMNQDASLEEIQPPSADYLALKEGEKVYYKDANNTDVWCTVLYASKDKDGNDTSYFENYGVQIIPRNPVTTLELGNGTGSSSYSTNLTDFSTAKASYNNAINILNTAAQTYVAAQPELAAIAKSSRCVGSIPNNPSYGNTAMYSHTEGSNNYFSSYDGQFNAGEEEATYKANNNNKANHEIDYTQLKNLSIINVINQTNGSCYWLASRIVSRTTGRNVPDSPTY